MLNAFSRSRLSTLSPSEKSNLEGRLKNAGASFVALLHEVGKTDASWERVASRDLSCAQAAMEEAVKLALRHVQQG